jgi:hypothetical protein
MGNNWKTTMAGIITIAISIGQAVLPWLQNGTPISWGIVATGVTAGVGLMVARDHDGPMTPSKPGG